MKKIFIGLLVLLILSGAGKIFAHPGSAIVADRQGNVYFLDTGSGLWKIDRAGKLTHLTGPAFHWMAIDNDGRFSDGTIQNLMFDGTTITSVGTHPTLLLSSDFPIAIGSDGNLYYPKMDPDKQMQVLRRTSSGSTTVVKRKSPAQKESGQISWWNGIATSPDGSIYYSEDRAVRKISPKGELTTVISNFNLTSCDSVPGVESDLGEFYRGLDVDSEGTVYVAATGCRAVFKITADHKVATVLRAESPWSPTAVALSGKDLYVLEYFHTPGENRREWLPRVRKVSSDGSIVMVATVKR